MHLTTLLVARHLVIDFIVFIMLEGDLRVSRRKSRHALQVSAQSMLFQKESCHPCVHLIWGQFKASTLMIARRFLPYLIPAPKQVMDIAAFRLCVLINNRYIMICKYLYSAE